MPPSLALFVCAVGTIGLFWLDRDRERELSSALWIPIIWLAIAASRNVSIWLGLAPTLSADDPYVEGSPLDRVLLSTLILTGICILTTRYQQTVDVLRRNQPLIWFFVFSAASVLWSDFPFVALKRWTKVLGNVVMVLIVLTAAHPAAELKAFLKRTAFLLIPSSILLIKYYPNFGRYYDRWTGVPFYGGVTDNKNSLGVTCLVLGLGTFCCLIDEVQAHGRRSPRLVPSVVILGMVLWLLYTAGSATSTTCFILGAALMVIAMRSHERRPEFIHRIVGAVVALAAVAYSVQSLFTFLVSSLGRDPTLTGRTELWEDLLRLNANPLLGAGFESFFLGTRLDTLWVKYWWHPNEAHNGYLEIYLTLGALGLLLLIVLIVTGYRHAMNVYRSDPSVGSLRIAYVVVAALYNITEAAFKITNPIWILFLLSVSAVQVPTTVQARQIVIQPASRRRFQRRTWTHSTIDEPSPSASRTFADEPLTKRAWRSRTRRQLAVRDRAQGFSTR